MGNRLLKIICYLSRPLRSNAVFFIFMYLLAAVAHGIVSQGSWEEFRYEELFVDLFAVCLLLFFLPHRITKWIRGFIFMVFLLVSLADCYTFLRFESTLTPTMLQLVLETEPREATEFLYAYVCNHAAVFLFLGFAILGVLYFACERYAHFWKWKLFRQVRLRKTDALYLCTCFTVVVWGLLGVSLYGVWETKQQTYDLLSQRSTNEMERMYNKGYGEGLYTSAYRLYFSLYANNLALEQIQTLKENVKKTRVDSCLHTVPEIVLIIGESYNRKHSELYGYTYPTTPCQKVRAAKGELIAYSNVVTSWNLTSNVFKNMFSLYSYGKDGGWQHETLFPVVFRKAGYQVKFITNQFIQLPDENAFDFSGGYFLNEKELSAQQFDARNTRKHEFDEGLLQDYDSLSQFDGAYNLTIFHLLGQHIGYENRYPANRGAFRPETYGRTDLNKEQKKHLADYDNATLYNDSVVNEILKKFEHKEAVVLYVPDHGEEVYDGIDVFGRLHSAALKPIIASNEFEIPFWIWGSNSFRKKHSVLFRQIKEGRHNPYMTDDLPHTLLYLAGIYCPGYDETRAVMSPVFYKERRRLLKGFKDYDKLMEASPLNVKYNR